MSHWPSSEVRAEGGAPGTALTGRGGGTAACTSPAFLWQPANAVRVTSATGSGLRRAGRRSRIRPLVTRWRAVSYIQRVTRDPRPGTEANALFAPAFMRAAPARDAPDASPRAHDRWYR